MGKIVSGLLGPVSGRVGGVVGARWKSVPYLRSYTVPGASRTDLQAAQRNAFGFTVAAARPFVGRILNPYYDKFLSRVSGFNRFISENISKYVPGETPELPLAMVTDGPLYPGSGLAGVWNTYSTMTVTWNTEHGVDGSDADVAIAWVRDPVSNAVAFSANATRVDGTVDVEDATLDELPAVDIGVFFIKMTGSVVTKISRNLVVAGVTDNE
jgi:hypothetical protein